MSQEIEGLFRQLAPAESPEADAKALRALVEDEKALELTVGKALARAGRAAALALAERIELLAPLLRPGNHPEGKADTELRPCGQADAVFWLAGVKNQQGTTIIPSAEREALRYLRPVPDAVKALLGHNPSWIGLSEPKGLEAEIAWVVALDRIAHEAGRRLRCGFMFGERGVNAIQPRHAPRWRCYKAAEDVWAVFYV